MFCAPAWGAKPFPETPRDYVHNEGVLSASAEQDLSRRLSSLEAATGRQFAVALFQSLDGESLEDYSNKLLRHWKLGQKGKNDGLLFCLYLKDRRWRVEIGYGLEGVLTDLEAAALVEEHAVPELKAGRVDQAVLNAAQALAAKLGGGAMPKRSARRTAPQDDDIGLLFWIVFSILGLLWSLWLNRRYRVGRRGNRYGTWSTVIDWGVSGGGESWGGGDSGGGFSGGGGSSGGGGASGSW